MQIAQNLKNSGIKTRTGKEWRNDYLYAVLKRYQERQERLDLIKKEYPVKWLRIHI